MRAARRANFARLAEQEGLEHGDRAHWYDSTPAHEAAEWARDAGAVDVLRHAIFRAYFVHDRNIGSADVLCEVAREVGIDPTDLRAALGEGRYRDRVAAQYQESRSMGATGVPTFVAANYAIVGAHPYENFLKLMEAVGAPRRRVEA